MLNTLRALLKGSGDSHEPKTEEQLLKAINPVTLPQHVAIIMDGNGRWAQQRGMPRGFGHRAGVESLREVVNICSTLGIKVLTVFAFSTENWKRPQEEVSILMDLLVEYLQKEIKELHSKNVVVNAIGRIEELPDVAQRALQDAHNLTGDNQGLVLNLCLNYGGRTEIVDACKKIAQQVKDGQVSVAEITDEIISRNLYTKGYPDPDLLIRPAGELRISNYLLWQLAYTEFWLTDLLWPDFRKKHLLQAILDFQNRKRRFGGL